MSSQRPQPILTFLGAASVLVGLLASPPVLARLATDDGRIDNEWLPFLLWPGSLGLGGLGLALLLLGLVPSVRSWVGRHRLLAAALAASLPLAGLGGFGLYVRAVNQVDLVERLDRTHPIGREIHAMADEDGHSAALNALLERSRSRPPAMAVPPYELWHTPPSVSAARRRAFLQGDLGDALERPTRLRWRPGAEIPWDDEDAAFWLQRQSFIYHVLRDLPSDIERDTLERLQRYVERWRQDNRLWPNFHPFAWNDDVMANRIVAHMWLQERRRAAELATLEDEGAFLRSLVQHGDQLMDPAHYTSTTNHGMMQNYALLLVSLAYPELDRGGEWRRTSLSRTAQYVRDSVASDGAFLEVAPGYHWFGMTQLLAYATACQRGDVPLDEAVVSGARRMLSFARELLQPDRTLPMIADTEGGPRSVAEWPWDALPDWPELEALREAMTDRQVPPNEPGVRLSREAGYFILRAPAPEWSLDSAMMLVFRAGPESRAHAHYDALSLTLYGNGRALLSGPGYPEYEMGLEERNRLIGTFQQNTVSVDGRSQDLGDAEMRFVEVGEGQGAQGPVDYVVVQGESRLYEGVVHRRTLLYGPSAASVAVIDELSSEQAHTYRQHFRLSEGLLADVDGEALAGREEAGGASLLRVRPLVMSDGDSVPARLSVSGPVATVERRGSRVRFVTLLELRDGDSSLRLDDPRALSWAGPLGRFQVGLPIDSPASVEWAGR